MSGYDRSIPRVQIRAMQQRGRVSWKKRVAWVLIPLIAVSMGAIRPAARPAEAQVPTAQSTDATELQRTFAAAAREFNVPEPVLLAVAYTMSRWEHHAGEPSTTGGYGVMHLTDFTGRFGGKGDAASRPPTRILDDPLLHTLDAAAALLQGDRRRLQRDPAQNIRGGAALLASYARDTVDTTPADPAAWYGAVARYSGSAHRGTALGFADTVYATIASGAARTTTDGQRVLLAPAAIAPHRATADRLNLRGGGFPVDCPATITCESIPAAYAQNNPQNPSDYGNYDLANRPADGLELRYIVIHDVEGSYTSAVQHFQNPQAAASTHYVIRSSDGHVAQMVENKHVAWHAGNWFVNGESIGIEHEGVAIEGATWYSEAMYQSSARLVRYLADRYAIPKDRGHIVGHDELPGPLPQHQAGMHWDPGPFWDWDHYMDLVRGPQRDPVEGGNQRLVTISPDFATNMPPLTYCYAANDCRDVPAQSANFVYLRTAPSQDAPYITNQYITAVPTRANNWANKAMAGQTFVRADQQGAWDAIYFGGQKAWFHNPGGVNTTTGTGITLAPKPGQPMIPVYGRAYPEAAAYPAGVPPQTIAPIYELPAGQTYVSTGLVPSAYYWSPVYTPQIDSTIQFPVTGTLRYYQIFFNHRFAFVKAEDVELVAGTLALDPGEAGAQAASGATITYTLNVTNTGQVETTLAVSLTGQTWATAAQLPPDRTLSPGERATILIRVTVPATADDGDQDQVWATISGTAEPSRSITALLTTRVGRSRIFLPLLRR